jgi:alkaline phosphatase D
MQNYTFVFYHVNPTQHFYLFLCIVALLGTSCKPTHKIPANSPQNNQQLSGLNDMTLQKIAFGSCAKQDLAQPLWQDIIANKPDVWVWLGDNIYVTPQATVEKMKQRCTAQLQNPDYQVFLKTNTPIIGTWDDNDYGYSDGGKNFVFKKESKAMMLDFLGVPENAPQRKREGVYTSYLYGKAKRQVKIILLDCRYFRDDLIRDTLNKKYLPNSNGDMLGTAQWQWLEDELKNSKAQVNIIGGGIQFLSDLHAYEKWSNLPTSRKKLFDLIQKYKPANTILISGDRHMGEISKISLPNYKNLYDITSSGITHTGTIFSEENTYRIGSSVHQLHYATIEIDWNKRPIGIVFKIIGEKNITLQEKTK